MMSDSTNLGCGSLTLKYLVFLFNLVFFLCGLILIIIGGIAQSFFKEYIQFFDNEFKTPAMGIILLGSVILIISFFGCCGARMENVCMLRTFSFFMALLLLCELAAGISIAILKSDIKAEIQKNMNSTMQHYGSNDSLATDTWDDMQKNLHCCGTYNYTDWFSTPWSVGKNVPDSCCKEKSLDCGKNAAVDQSVVAHLYLEGCANALKDAALRNLGIIIGAAIAIAGVQLIGIWMSSRLVRAVKDHYEVL